MAQPKRSPRTRGGGKLALFEVIQAAQAQGEGQLSDAVAPLVAASSAREAPPEPAPVAAPPRKTLVQAPALPPGEAGVRRRRQGRQPGVSALSFATAIAGAIALGGAGLVIFQHFSKGRAQEIGGSAPMPEVLDVGGGGSQQLASRLPEQQSQVRTPPPAGAASVPGDFRRVNGINYVLVQSYALSEEEHAVAMRDALLKNGIGATIERDVPGWPRRLCIVGTEGFEHLRTNTKYQEYRRRLDEISRVASASDRRIKKFDPQAIQWGRS